VIQRYVDGELMEFEINVYN